MRKAISILTLLTFISYIAFAILAFYFADKIDYEALLNLPDVFGVIIVLVAYLSDIFLQIYGAIFIFFAFFIFIAFLQYVLTKKSPWFIYVLHFLFMLSLYSTFSKLYISLSIQPSDYAPMISFITLSFAVICLIELLPSILVVIHRFSLKR
ncbi:MAG: hypothetical protein U1C51_05705 [Candidatus Izemoplasmatales bacterium]|nr:hypothetical protein [bacterium]MDZ4196730.1 hypothetical protein [Candidatus Izemoplasmatales bacterium]